MEEEILIGPLEGKGNSSFRRQIKSHPGREFPWIGCMLSAQLGLLAVTCLLTGILDIPLLAKLTAVTGVTVAGPISTSDRVHLI